MKSFQMGVRMVALASMIAGAVAAEKQVGNDLQEKVKNNYGTFAVRHLGDVNRGQALFSNSEKTACSKCHTTNGDGGLAGPDLFAIGDKFGRKDLIDAVLNPSASIAVGYSNTHIETQSGLEYSGVIKGISDEWIELIGVEGKPIRVNMADIDTQRISEVSLMPEGLYSGVSMEEFADIIAFLSSLRVPETAYAAIQGMPREIPTVRAPIVLHPFHSESMRFENPVWFGEIPGLPNGFLVLEHQTGKVWLLEKEGTGDRKTLFLDLGAGIIQGGTRGLLGLAFHPRFAQTRKYYLALHVVLDGRVTTMTVEREAASDFRRDSGHSPRTLMKIEAATNVHYGGGLMFGPDGYLYVGMGDTGPQEDPMGNGQNTLLLRGKLMRIDVDHKDQGREFRIPPDNPYVGSVSVRPEIWALGFREPWRFSFDSVTGDVWVGDVGQDLFEEVDIVRPGENYGWNVFEGFAPFSNRYRRTGEAYVPPVFAYTRKQGPSVTGGFVYRADPASSFYGVYIFGDYETRHIWGMTQENRVLKTIREIGVSPQRIVSFGNDARGGLYIVGYEGMIYRMDFAGAVFE